MVADVWKPHRFRMSWDSSVEHRLSVKEVRKGGSPVCAHGCVCTPLQPHPRVRWCPTLCPQVPEIWQCPLGRSSEISTYVLV